MMVRQEWVLGSSHHSRKIGVDVRFLNNLSKPLPVIVFVHGFKGFKDWAHFNLIASAFAEQGFFYIKINLSHNGTTPFRPMEFTDLEGFGHQTFTRDLEDLKVLIDYLLTPQFTFKDIIDPEKIYLLGHSRGGGISILKASQDERIKKVAVWASIYRTDFVWNEKTIADVQTQGVTYIENARTGQQMPLYKEVYEELTQNKDRFDLLKASKNLVQPLLLVHGDVDASVKFEGIKTLQEQVPGSELYMIWGANHTFGGRHPYVATSLPEHTLMALEQTIRFFRS